MYCWRCVPCRRCSRLNEILRLMPLSPAFPVAAGALVIGTMFVGVVFLSEVVSVWQWCGYIFDNNRRHINVEMNYG
jgi:hypothetical protein